MASSHGNVQAEPAKMEQIITEFFPKILHIVLESRCSYVSSRNFSGEQTVSSPSSSSSSSSSVRPRDKWFNLALRECPAALENIDFWRQSYLEPMVIDIILVQRPLDWDAMHSSPRKALIKNVSMKERFPNYWNSNQEEFGCETKNEKIIERWVVQYESRKSRDISLGSRRSNCTSSHIVYKKSILLLRSLYSTVRLLPAYKLFRDLNSSAQIRTFTLAHRVSSLVEPFTRREEAEMQRFGFTPVDTSCGRLCLSVLYRPSLSDVSSESSIPMSPQFIQDYVGSPLADPLKRFPSVPVTGRGSQGSPASSPYSRRHSWSNDFYRASPPSIYFSSSPTNSESCAMGSNPNSRRLPPMSLPPHPPETYLVHNKNTSFDDNWPPPTFSPSTSPSPPTHMQGSHLSRAPLHYGSAPVSIPTSKIGNVSAMFNKHALPPSPPLKGSRPSSLKTEKSSGSARSATVEKLFTHGKEETGKFSGVRISSTLSRSSSRLSFQDDFEDSVFACPFDVDDEDMTNPGSRPESFDQKGLVYESPDSGGLFPVRKSQDAAVGALVHMLKKAPPLRQDSFKSVTLSQGSRTNSNRETSEISGALAVQHVASSSIMSSTLLAAKTAADALEELQTYREMKDLLLNRGSRSNTLVKNAYAAEPSSSKATGYASAAEPSSTNATVHPSASEPSSSEATGHASEEEPSSSKTMGL